MLNEKKKIGKIQAAGIALCALILVMRLCSGMIGGGFHDFYAAAFPWLVMGLAAAIVLACSAQHREEGRIIEKQDTRIEEES